MAGICYVFGAGMIEEFSFCPGEEDYVIAADGGFEYTERMGIRADMVVGDFDSLGRLPQHKNVKRFPIEKDATDMALAMEEGRSLGYEYFVLYGGVGGRFDHTMANIQTLAQLAAYGCRGYLVGGQRVMTVIKDEALAFKAGLSGYISVFCHGAPAKGVGIRGLKYELSDATLLPTQPLGVSNEFCGRDACVSVRQGMLLIMWNEEPFKPESIRHNTNPPLKTR